MTGYLMNRPEDLVLQAVEGFVGQHADTVVAERDPLYVRRRHVNTDKVALISGGGSGHEPLHLGFVGEGMLDAAVPGAVFSSPTALQVRAAIKGVTGPSGALLIVKNYTGDVLNFSIAAEVESDNYTLATVVVDDDLATNTGGPGRRGTAAVIVVEKLCGAAAQAGAPLAEVRDVGTDVVARSATLSVAYRACTNPLTGKRSFDLGPHQIEFGVGIHGERGVDTRTVSAADDLVAHLLDLLLAHLEVRRGDDVLVIVNGLGATHGLELAVAARSVANQLTGRGITLARSLVGSYVTALDMHGFSLTVTRVDESHVRLWDAPVRTAALTW